MKKIFAGTLFSLLLIGVVGYANTASATEIEQPETEESEFVVFPETDINPIELEIPAVNDGTLYQKNPLLRDGTVPSREKKLGSYNFSGSFNGKGTLYTSYKFYGGTKYRVTINNKSKKAITVVAKRTWKTYGSTKVSAGKSGTIEFSNINSDTRFWVEFQNLSGSVSGTVKKI